MNTVEQIMEIVSDYASEIADIASSESVFAHIGKSRYAYRDKTLADLRTAIEELHRDAARYRHIKDNIQVGAVKTMLPLYRVHHWHGYEDAGECPDLDAAIDAAMKEST